MKKLSRAIAVMLCFAMLTGCTFMDRVLSIAQQLNTPTAAKEIVPFDRMEYIRPDMDAIAADFEEYKSLLTQGAQLSELEAALDVCYADYYTYDTMYTIADIRSCADITDEYYAGEYDFCSENYSALQQLIDDMYYASAASDKAQELEDSYFWEGFCEQYSDPDASYYNDETVRLMQRESSIISRYRALCANPTIEIDGEEVDYNEYISELFDEEEYKSAIMAYYNKYNPLMAELFIELVNTRNELADTLGFDSYEELAYVFYQERDYTPAQANEYLKDIKKYIVPLYKEVMSTDPYDSVEYSFLGEIKLYSTLRKVTQRIGGDVQDAFEFMSDYELYDISVSTKKAAMSFQTYLEDYEAPYLFLNPYGDVEDILSFAHEFGHYTDAYINYNAYETTDVAECFSQAMEYLVLSYLDGVLDEDELENLTLIKMLDTLELYAQQAAYAEFETEVYAMDDPTVDEINELSLRVCRDYGCTTEGFEEYDAMSWIDITHYFEAPFYIITYPVSNDFAMQIYELERDDPGSGLEKYLDTIENRYDMLMDTLEAGGMESPFAQGRLQKVAQTIREFFE